ncbi:hypothetical protein VDGE_30110 [Verticillium dahliae]|uniref:Secreted protein n=1 Tax=Verticillium dahliae TaxID=27337 RepID=A0A444S4K8_VERDA|nr:hypothetical protein VDGE_30110 [Verticillium dahliae]
MLSTRTWSVRFFIKVTLSALLAQRATGFTPDAAHPGLTRGMANHTPMEGQRSTKWIVPRLVFFVFTNSTATSEAL